MNTRRRGSIACALIVTLFMAAQASATNVPRMSFDDLVDNTALAFVGTVIESDPTHFDEQRNEPATKVTFLIDEVLKGTPSGPEVAFVIPGGEYPNGEILEYENSPVFLENETYVIFVRDGPWTITPITNWWHSAFRSAEVDGKQVLVNQFGQAVTKIDDEGFSVGPRVDLPERALMRLSHSERAAGRGGPSDAQLFERSTAKLNKSDDSAKAMLLHPGNLGANTASAKDEVCSDCARADGILDSLGTMIHERAATAALAAPKTKSLAQVGRGGVMSRPQPLLALHREISEDKAETKASPGSFSRALEGPTNHDVENEADVDAFPQED